MTYTPEDIPKILAERRAYLGVGFDGWARLEAIDKFKRHIGERDLFHLLLDEIERLQPSGVYEYGEVYNHSIEQPSELRDVPTETTTNTPPVQEGGG